MAPCVFSLCHFEMQFFIFYMLSLMPFLADKQCHAWPGAYTTTLLVPVSNREETKMGLVQP